jgi:putative ABC transport system substrate-binding protein
MKRRELIVLMAGAAAWLPAARAQPATPVIGYLRSGSAVSSAPFTAGFVQGLAEAGYVEGRNVLIEYRGAEGRYDQLPALAAELVRLRVALILATGGNGPAQAAKAATSEIPIVFVSGGDPVKAGLVASLSRPGGNVTGVSWIAAALVSKQLELLHELVPTAATVGALVNPSYPDIELQLRELNDAAAALKQRIYVEKASTEPEIDVALQSLAERRVDGLLVANDPFLAGARRQLVAQAARHALPAVYSERQYTIDGGLISYGADLVDEYRQGGSYAGRILKGAKPAELPVLQPTMVKLVINLKTAKALGLTVVQSLLARADEVIE